MTESPRRTTNGRGTLFFTLGISALIALLTWAFDGCGGEVEGHVTVTGGPHGAFTLEPAGCASLQPFGHFGANLHGERPNDGAVYVTLDHSAGKRVELEVPGSCLDADGTDCTVFPVLRDRCSVYDVKVEPSGTVVNGVRLVEGHVRLECALEDGTEVRGQLVYEGC
jgi:hypothetical protein